MAALYILHLILLWLLLDGTLAFLFNDAMHRIGPGTDFWAYYDAANQWRQGNGIYGHGPGYGFRYHPLTAIILFAPLTFFDDQVSYSIWVVINELMLLLDLVLLRKLFSSRRDYIIASVALLLFSPLLLELFMGNASFVVASMLLAAFYYYHHGVVGKFTLVATVSVLLKPVALVFLPLLLLRKQVKTALVLLIVPLVSAIPYFVIDPVGWRHFASANFGQLMDAGWHIHAGNQGLWCLATNLIARLSGVPPHVMTDPGQLSMVLQAAIHALPVLLGVLSLWMTWRLRDNWRALVFIWSVTYLLGYKDVWEHSYSFIILGLVFLYLSRTVDSRLILICTVGLALPTAFALYDVSLPPGYHDPESYWPLGIAALHHSTKVVWLLILYVACLWQSLSTRSVRSGSA
ncbi:MAG: glycosyltransferase 87 family protein [Candidatus Zixiibacteriota bacterium]